jgi:hypothetical protein
VVADKIRLAYDAETAIQSAELHWTPDLDKPWQQREWKSAFGQVLGLHEIEVDLPKDRPCVYFLTLKDNRGAIVSTEHAELR